MNVVYLYENFNVNTNNLGYLQDEKVLYTCPPGKIAKVLAGPVGKGRVEPGCSNIDFNNNQYGNIELNIGEDLLTLYGSAENSNFLIAPLQSTYAAKASESYESIKSDRTLSGWAVFRGMEIKKHRLGSDILLFPGEIISIKSQSRNYEGTVSVNMKIIEDNLN